MELVRELEMKWKVFFPTSNLATAPEGQMSCLTLFRLIGYAILINWMSIFV